MQANPSALIKAATLAAVMGVSSAGHAAGVAKLLLRTQNDQFTSSGTIEATSQSSGGASTAVAAQRVIAPLLTFSADYSSRNNRYLNSGTIRATSRASGGVSTAFAAQDAVL